MLIRRAEWRLALVAGLGNGLAELSGLPFGYYVPLAVLAMGTGSYGGSLGLGRQRILGSVLGSLLVVVGSRGLAGVPMPLGLAITLAALRLIGGALGLQVGYKVGGVIVVMGWLVHGTQLDGWIGLRLGWTCLGVILTLLSLRLFWPSQAVEQAFAGRATLLAEVGQLYGGLADRLDRATAAANPAANPAATPTATPTASASSAGVVGLTLETIRALQKRQNELRRQVPSLEEEFGNQASRHPAARLIQALDRAGTRLLQAAAELVRRPPPPGEHPLLEQLHGAEADLLHLLAERLDLWRQSLGANNTTLPPLPDGPLALPASWRNLERDLHDPALAQVAFLPLERLAGRLMACRGAHQAMREAEGLWLGLQASGRDAHQRSSR